MDAATFRQNFPEFIDAGAYPDGQVNFWLGVADKQLPEDRWADMKDMGVQLYTAHHLAIGRRDQLVGSAGGIPGDVRGAVTAKTVDKVSTSFDAASALYEGAGFWNQTSYGVRLYQLIRMVGAGGLQL